jgi:DNA-binding GntR family transcriptional regulator
MATSVYEEIREAILSGHFPPNHLLVENARAIVWGPAPPPGRAPLHRLEIEQLVERASRGMRVRSSSPEEILDIYDVRITLEGAAAKQAALRATELDRMRLRSAQAAMARAGHDPAERAAANRAFHEALWQASHSATLVDLLQRLNTHLIRYPTTTLTHGDRWQVVLEEHENILRAIEAGDTKEAHAIAERHMVGAREVRLQMYSKPH